MTTTNDQLILIAGESGSGKSASLMKLRNQDRVLYLNCEAGKRLPFRNKFDAKVITDPYQVHEAFEYTMPGQPGNGAYDVIIVDTLTFLMDMFESQYIIGSANTMAGWSQYQQYYKRLMQDLVAKSDKKVIILAHTREDLDEKAMEYKTSVPIKGALKNNGIEAFEESALAA